MKEHRLIFNAEMIRALLDGRKTRTCRRLKDINVSFMSDNAKRIFTKPYSVGDLIYAKKTYDVNERGDIIYRADYPDGVHPEGRRWHSSLFMPKEAARLWLEITGLKVMQIQDTTEEEAKQEGFRFITPFVPARYQFLESWEKRYPEGSRNDWVIALTFREYKRRLTND